MHRVRRSEQADTLLEAHHHANPDALSLSDLQALLDDVQPPCPACGEASWSPVAAENLMFDTVIGAGSSGRAAFLRQKRPKACSRPTLPSTGTSVSACPLVPCNLVVVIGMKFHHGKG